MKSITAHDLVNGNVVFLGTAGTWSKYVEDAALYEDADAITAALALAERDEDRQLVVGPYEIDMEIVGDAPTPVKLKEKIRAGGPTTAYGEKMEATSFYAG